MTNVQSACSSSALAHPHYRVMSWEGLPPSAPGLLAGQSLVMEERSLFSNMNMRQTHRKLGTGPPPEGAEPRSPHLPLTGAQPEAFSLRSSHCSPQSLLLLHPPSFPPRCCPSIPRSTCVISMSQHSSVCFPFTA